MKENDLKNYLNKISTEGFSALQNGNIVLALKKFGASKISLSNRTKGKAEVLKKIYSLGCRNLLVEGGKTLTNSFLKYKIFNQFYLFKSSNKLGNNKKLNVGGLLNQLTFKYKKKSKLNSFTGDDIIYLYSK